jgi:hypothetical protein
MVICAIFSDFIHAHISVTFVILFDLTDMQRKIAAITTGFSVVLVPTARLTTTNPHFSPGGAEYRIRHWPL